MFLLDYINKYSWNLNFIQGTLNFFQYICHMFLLAEFLGIPTNERGVYEIELRYY